MLRYRKRYWPRAMKENLRNGLNELVTIPQAVLAARNIRSVAWSAQLSCGYDTASGIGRAQSCVPEALGHKGRKWEIKNDGPFSRFSPSRRRTFFRFLTKRKAAKCAMTRNQRPAPKTKNDDGVMRVPRASRHFLFSEPFPFCRHYTRNDAKTQGYGEIASFPKNAKKWDSATL